jgi:hypothetical protein
MLESLLIPRKLASDFVTFLLHLMLNLESGSGNGTGMYSGSGIGSAKENVVVPAVPVPQHCAEDCKMRPNPDPHCLILRRLQICTLHSLFSRSFSP